MARPNPMILVMGAAPLAQVAGMVWASKTLPYGVRLAGTWACVALAVACIGAALLGVIASFKKKKLEAEQQAERRRLRTAAIVGASGSAARRASADDPPSRDGS